MFQSYKNANRNPWSGQTQFEPLAIIGLGCRLPGNVENWRGYWRLLESAIDAIQPTPAERWNLQKFYSPNQSIPGKTQSRWGGYVTGLEQFDPQLFGISPREAAGMDPQQRLLLEVAFRAFEDAGQPLSRVAGRPISVFAGISSFDYAVAGLSYRDRGVIDAYSNTGGSSSIAANRISYCFDLRGPSVAVDTACSSSLVAVHMACESLWRGEAEMALAGGVNALIMPDFYVAFSQLGVLSPDGRCKTFDARANGYVRSEGAGMILIKPLTAALRDKDAIYALIRSTALNQDGRTPGMTVPSQLAQEALIQTACEKGGVAPADIQYVEAHGTGTPVGDPIEATAIGRVVGEGRQPDQPCWVGSVKTNIGHLEAGAGIASLIKVALAMHHRQIPAHLHFQTANPNIDLAALNLRIPTRLQNWDFGPQPRLAGINGFGYGGANAHIIVEQAPEHTRGLHAVFGTGPHSHARSLPAAPLATPGTKNREQLDAPVLIPLSARSTTAVAQAAMELADWLESAGSQVHLAEVAGFLAHRRTHHERRATACAAHHAEMIDALRTLAAATPAELTSDLAPAKLQTGIAFICSGQGPQWWGMGRGLLKYSPAFRSVIKRCDTEFSKYTDWSLLEELSRNEVNSRMQKTSIAQPSIFAIQVALAALWDSWGIRPRALVGHSVGEIAAAYLSGALNWEDACCVAYQRGRTMDLASSHGAMLAVGMSAAEVAAWLEGLENQVSLAAINGPSSVTISGDADVIESLAKRCEQAGYFCRRLAVEYAFHSPQMEPVRNELLSSLAHIQPKTVHTPLISTVTGGMLSGTEMGAEYWWQNVRQSVRFSDAMAGLAQQGFGLAIEVGPHPVLAYAINECFQAAGSAVHTVPSLNRQQDDLYCISKSLGNIYAMGFDIDWSGFYNAPSRKLDLPGYPFQRQRCWSESIESSFSRLAIVEHPLLGEAILSPTPRWEQRLDLKVQSYLTDHRVRGATVYPAAAIIESAIAAARLVNPIQTARLRQLRLLAPCVLGDDRPQWIETAYDSQRRQLTIAFREAEKTEWRSLATVEISSQPVSTVANPHATQTLLKEIEHRCRERFQAERVYAYCAELGLHYGKKFQGIVHGYFRPGEALAEVILPLDLQAETGADVELAAEHVDQGKRSYNFHPALLDSCFHAMIVADRNFDHRLDGLYLPAEINEIQFYRQPSERLWVHAKLISKSPKVMLCDVDIYTEAGELCMSLQRFESRRVTGGQPADSSEDLIYSYSWQPQVLSTGGPSTGRPSTAVSLPCLASDVVLGTLPTSAAAVAGCWVILMDEGHVGQELCQRLKSRGGRVFEVYRERSAVPQSGSDSFYQIDPESRESFIEVLSKIVGQCNRAEVSNSQTASVNALNGLVYLWGLDAASGDERLNVTSLNASTVLTALAPLYLVQAWESLEQAPQTRLAVVTAGAQSLDSELELTDVAQAPLIGIGRVIASEIAKFRTKLIDLPRNLLASDIDHLLDELLCVGSESTADEDEVLWRDGDRFVHRFSPQVDRPIAPDAARSVPCQLRLGSSAGIEELHYRSQPERALRAGELEIEVLATGLNFSDVMKALDLYPGLPDGPVELGAECSGRVVRVGAECEFAVGDEVIAIAPGAFATRAIVNKHLVAPKPHNLTHAQAAAIPVAFLTADYALHECARLTTGQSVLIHAASGGVGLAAIQLGLAAGIEILATAGSDEKRDYLRQLGVNHVMDSRSLAFGDQTLCATSGQGVDAVLNSLPGEAIRTGLSVLKTGGKFLEIGKRDIYNDAPLGLHPFRNNLALFAIDLDQLFKQQPEQMGLRLRRLAARFEAGELQPLPVTSYTAPATRAAFRFMQQGKHIGKVVVEYTQRPTEIRAGQFPDFALNADASYWIAGGQGGFGLEIARWLAKCGAQSIVLSGRSRELRPAAQKVVSELQQQGVRVSVIPADITRADEVRSVLMTIDREMPPLRGVIHAAMVLEDKLLVDLDRPTLERVLRPKVLGGWNLHHETLGRKLELFVMFSSLSSVFGHAGQANYAAANALLDSLAYHRRAQGLPALVMNWGHLGEVGYLAERVQLGQRLERQGVLSFTVQQATECLEYALNTQAIQLSVLRMDWSLWRGLGITDRVSPRFAHLLRQSKEQSQCEELATNAVGLRAAHAQRRATLVEGMLRNKAGALLGISTKQLPTDRGLLELGLDSLMAVEFRNWIESHMQINLPISALMRSDCLTALVVTICELIEASAASAEPQRLSGWEPQVDAEQLLASLPELGEDDVARLLEEMLRQPAVVRGSPTP